MMKGIGFLNRRLLDRIIVFDTSEPDMIVLMVLGFMGIGLMRLVRMRLLGLLGDDYFATFSFVLIIYKLFGSLLWTHIMDSYSFQLKR